MSATLFQFGPYAVCLWNIVIIAIVILSAIIARKLIHRFLKRYLISANVSIEGKRVAWLRLFSQSVYALALYFSILSFNINNSEVSFREFLDYRFIQTTKISISFENVLLVFVIFFFAKTFLSIIQLYLQRRFRKDKNYNRGTEYVYMKVAKYIVYTIAVLFSLGALDVEPSIFLGGSAALLVGVGLGLQDVFKDMFSGFVLLFEGTIRVDDIIEFRDGKSPEPIVAKILQINIRTTQIETRDGNVLIVPNAKLTQEYIENFSHGSTLSRFRINITVSYQSDTQLISDLLVQAAMAHPKVKKTEPLQVRINNFGDNGLQMELIFWADQSWDINQYKSEIRFEIDRLFRQYNVEIPFPQRTVHMVKEA